MGSGGWGGNNSVSPGSTQGLLPCSRVTPGFVLKGGDGSQRYSGIMQESSRGLDPIYKACILVH